MTLHCKPLAGVAPEAWRNGGGQTRTLLAWPAPQDWWVRVSVADIDASGPFSAFVGVQRCFAVLQGEGVCLRLDGVPTELRTGQAPLSFDGAHAPDCTLLGGPTRDLNLMGRADRGQPCMADAATVAHWPAGGGWRALYTTADLGLCHGGAHTPVAAHSLVWSENPGDAWSLAGPVPPGQAWWMRFDLRSTQ